MSLLDDDLPAEFLHKEETEEAVLVEVRQDVINVMDDENAVIYVDENDLVMPEEVYDAWPGEAVDFQEVSDSEAKFLLLKWVCIRFTPDTVDIIEDQDQIFLDDVLPLKKSMCILVEGIAYGDDELLPFETNTMVEFDEIPQLENTNRNRRKAATIVTCEVCGVLLKHPSKIRAHMRTHTGEKPFECDLCGMKFSQRTPMLNHVRRHLGQTPYDCGFGCGKKFVNNAQKNAHELRHLGSKRAGPPRPHLKPPKRSLWNKSFAKTDHRMRLCDEEHPPIKRRTRPYRAPMLVQCQICGLMLKHASKIRAHIRTHTGDKPYICVYCDEHFGTSGTLSMHIKRKHTFGERPYACTWDCGKRFVSLSTRNEHERVVHAGTKRYECSVAGCFRMFSRRYYLMLHRQREHGLSFKPIFNPEEIAKAEKEADSELAEPNQVKASCDYNTSSSQVLVDPSTNMLVHVSENGMVLQQDIDQHAFMQGEFVEENEDGSLVEVVDSSIRNSHSVDSAESLSSQSVRFILSDGPLDQSQSSGLCVPRLENGLTDQRNEQLPIPMEEKDIENLGNAFFKVAVRNERHVYPRTRMVNILKKKLSVRPSTHSLLKQYVMKNETFYHHIHVATRMFEEAATAVGTSGMNYMKYDSPVHTTAEELDVGEEGILDFEESRMGSYDYNMQDKFMMYNTVLDILLQESSEHVYERSSTRKYRMVRRKPAQTFYCSPCNKEIKSIYEVIMTHYQRNGKSNSGLETVVIEDTVENEAICDDDVEVTTVDTHIYACPVVECGMQSQIKEEVEEHIAVVHGEMEDWIDGGEAEVYTNDSETIVVDGNADGSSQIMEAGQESIIVPADQEYEYYPYDGTIVMEDTCVDTVELQQPEVALQSDSSQALHTSEESSSQFPLYENQTYVDDASVPPPTEEIEVSSFLLNRAKKQLSTMQFRNDMELFYVNLPHEDTSEDRVRVLLDPKPPKKGRLTYDEYYQRVVNKNLQEMEVGASTIQMAAPVRHVSMMTEEGPMLIAHPSSRSKNRLIRSQYDRPHRARNLDWIIDAVARGVDIDSASPHNRRKPVMHKCQYCGRVDKYPSKIRAHLRTHTGEKPFKCEICGMTFAQRTPMRLHVRRHLDQKPWVPFKSMYVCTIEGCGVRFVSGALLNYHQQTKHFMTKRFGHISSRYICLKGCGRFFASARNQRNHEARCLYNTELAHDFGDAIYEHLADEELANALEAVESTLEIAQEKNQ
ncbi:unnamed protein product [Angiostrongylus costaricensis]|uniref:Zinc finger protein n=1 Tax=Angiostrongylus costaricensis TaxID=334426 RepID=A0A158PJM9_ANGCS|nr:unnamed protein product [Angiostrongylus costaricensis]